MAIELFYQLISAWCGKIVGMADTEKDKRVEQGSSRVGGDDGGQKKEAPTLSFLQVFLNNLKVHALMK